MILNALVYTVVEKVSFWDEILNILTAVGTVSAVMLSLYFSRDEKRIKKLEELENNEKIKDVIYISLNNSLNRMLRYRNLVKNLQFMHKKQSAGDVYYIYFEEYKTSDMSLEAHLIFRRYFTSNIGQDLLFVSTQLTILNGMEVNRVSLEWVNSYYTAISNLTLLKKSIEEIINSEDEYIKIASFLKNLERLIIPIEKEIELLKTRKIV